MNEDHHINDQQLPSGMPFRTDNAYFDDFASRLQDRIADLEEIKTMAPVLTSIPKYSPFLAPAEYFEEFPERIGDVARNSKKVFELKDWLLLLIRPRFVVPVAATILIAIAGINYMNRNADLPVGNLEELSLEEHLYDIDEHIIIETLTAQTAEEDESDDENSIENYLIENDIDESTLEL